MNCLYESEIVTTVLFEKEMDECVWDVSILLLL